MTRAISTPSRTKEILEIYGLRARKNFGQNFLVDPVIVERCAKASHCEGAVIEIGPGRALSGFVAKTAGNAISCYAIEDAASLEAAVSAVLE